jgi:hypothetical protein
LLAGGTVLPERITVRTLGPVAARRLLFLAAVVLVPVPYWAVEVERAPVVRLVALAVMTGGAAVTEPGGVVSILAGFLVLQALLWLVALALAARLIVRLLPEGRRGQAVAAVVGVLAGASLLRIYHTPFSRAEAWTNVLGILR